MYTAISVDVIIVAFNILIPIFSFDSSYHMESYYFRMMWKEDVRSFTSPYVCCCCCCCCCCTDGSRADKEEPVEMKTTSSLSLMTASEASTWKHYHCWPRDTSAKTKFVPNDHHDQHQQHYSTMESATSLPWRRLILCLLLYSPVKEASLFSLLLSCRSLLCHRYWPNNRAAAAVPVLFFLFLTCEGDLELRSPVGSDDLCAVLCPLCGLLICVCVCECVLIIHRCEDLRFWTYKIGTFL